MWPVQALTTFAAVDTVFTVGLLSQIATHSNLLPEQHRLAYLGAIGLFSTVPPLLLGVLRWIRTRLVTSLSEESGPDGEVLVVMGFPSLLPGSSAVGSTLSFRAEDLRTEYDGGASAELGSVSPSPARIDGHYRLQVQKKLGAKTPQKNVTEQRLRGERVRVIWSKRGETGACMRKPSHACSYRAVHTRCKCTHGVRW